MEVHISVKRSCKEYGINHGMVSKWTKEYLEGSEVAFEPKARPPHVVLWQKSCGGGPAAQRRTASFAQKRSTDGERSAAIHSKVNTWRGGQKTTGMIYGCVRVATREQNGERQRIATVSFKVGKFFMC